MRTCSQKQSTLNKKFKWNYRRWICRVLQSDY
jgi:hypothetical protein